MGMQGSKAPATLVICATVPGGLRGGADALRQRFDLPLTWVATWEALAVAADLAERQAGSAVALQLPEAAGESRQRLRTILARGRDIVPGLASVAIRGPVTPAVRTLLVEEGIRAAVVELFGPMQRGSRRPAPAGWRCRNAAWGLWEVEVGSPRPPSALSWLGLATMARPRRRSLHVFRIDGVVTGNAGAAHASHRLERRLAWARRHVARGTAEVIAISRLTDRLAGHELATADRSVLRAA